MPAVRVSITTTEYLSAAFSWYEIFASETNLALAAVVASAEYTDIGFATSFIHPNLTAGQTWYYWVRAAYDQGAAYSSLRALGSLTVDSGVGSSGAGGTVSDEHIRDVIVAMLVGGPNVTLIEDDPSDTLEIDVSIPSDSGGTFMSPYYDAVVKPVAADFTVAGSTGVNHGTVALTDLNDRGVLFDSVLANTGVLTQGFAYKAAVGNTLVKVEAFFQQVWDISGAWFFGVAVRDNAGKIHAWGFRDNQFSEFKYTDISNLSGQTNYGSINAAFQRLPLWVRIVKNGANFELSYSLNGEVWILVATVSATSFIGATINDVGIFTVNNVSSTTNHMKIACYSFDHS